MSSQYRSLIKKQIWKITYLIDLVIFGPQVQVKQINFSNKFNLHQLSTGELLRIEIKNQTVLGSKISSIMNSGDLVSDEINYIN